MTTITIDETKFKEKFSSYELKMKIINFLEEEMWGQSLDLYEVSIDDLPEDVLKSYKNIDNISFIKR